VTTVDDCRTFEFRRIENERGAITPVECGRDVPFDVARVYYLYDVPAGAVRGGHAHRALEQVVVSLMGSFEVILDDGLNRKRVLLNRPHVGLYLPRMIWRELENFSSGGISVVLASKPFDEDDYIRGYDDFLRRKREGGDA